MGVLIVKSGAKDTVVQWYSGYLALQILTGGQTLSQVNIAVNVQLRNVTSIAQTEALGLELHSNCTYRSCCWTSAFYLGGGHVVRSMLSKTAIKV